jgi:hypothetical protein
MSGKWLRRRPRRASFRLSAPQLVHEVPEGTAGATGQLSATVREREAIGSVCGIGSVLLNATVAVLRQPARPTRTPPTSTAGWLVAPPLQHQPAKRSREQNASCGTDREISAGFDRESSATRVDRTMCGETSAYVNLARHAVRCAGQRWRQSVAWRSRALTGRPGVRVH